MLMVIFHFCVKSNAPSTPLSSPVLFWCSWAKSEALQRSGSTLSDLTHICHDICGDDFISLHLLADPVRERLKSTTTCGQMAPFLFLFCKFNRIQSVHSFSWNGVLNRFSFSCEWSLRVKSWMVTCQQRGGATWNVANIWHPGDEYCKDMTNKTDVSPRPLSFFTCDICWDVNAWTGTMYFTLKHADALWPSLKKCHSQLQITKRTQRTFAEGSLYISDWCTAKTE